MKIFLSFLQGQSITGIAILIKFLMIIFNMKK